MISRVYGLGSVFGKTFRDSIKAALGIGVLVGVLNAVTAWTVAQEFPTASDRALFAAQMEALPALFQGLIGQPVNIETLPGFVSWRLVGFLPVMVGFFSIVALTGTLAGEATSGTLELILSTPVSRVRLAVQKYAAHVAALMVAFALVAVLTWVGVSQFATLPQDSMDISAAFAEFGMVAAMSLLVGSIGFAVAALLGRGLGAGVAAIYLFGSYAVNGYADIVPGFGVLRLGSMFHWTEHHRPMAGIYDWPPVLAVCLLALLFAALGVWLFQRRDLGATVSLTGVARRLGLGGRGGGGGRVRQVLGRAATGQWSLSGPGLRSLGERLPAALAWGAGLGLYGFVIAVSAEEFAASLSSVPQIIEMIKMIYPDIDFTTAGGILQLAIFGFIALVTGVAAGMLVAGWASDERERRLEVVLSTPMRRASWFIRSAVGVLVSVLVIGLVVGLTTGLGAQIAGDSGLPVVAGGLVIGMYAAALAGVGILVFGLGWPQLAGGAVGGATLGFYLVDLLGGILQLPDFVTDISLTRHLGQPMAGVYDWPGMVLCVVVAVGGTLIGAWRFARRDLS